MVRSTVFNLFFYSFTFVSAMGCWTVAKFSTRQATWRVVRFWGKTNLAMLRLILGSRVELRGLEHLKQGKPQIIVSKHQSELDIVMIAVTMWDPVPIAMQELERLPFFGAILRKLEAVMVAVDGGPQGRTRQAVEGALRSREEGRHLLIYPEGELMKLGARERYRRGVGHIYAAAEVEVVPVAISHGVIWPQREWRKTSRARAVMEFLEPIQPGLPFDDFMAEIEHRIETRTMELIEECANGSVLKAARERFERHENNYGEVADRRGPS